MLLSVISLYHCAFLVIALTCSTFAHTGHTGSELMIHWHYDVDGITPLWPDTVVAHIGDAVMFHWSPFEENHTVVSGTPENGPDGKFMFSSPVIVTILEDIGFMANRNYSFYDPSHNEIRTTIIVFPAVTTTEAPVETYLMDPAFNQVFSRGVYTFAKIYRNYQKKAFFAISPIQTTVSAASEIDSFIQMCKETCLRYENCNNLVVQQLKVGKQYKCFFLTSGGKSIKTKAQTKKSGLSFDKVLHLI